MKAHDAVRTTTLRLIKNALKNKFIERPQPDPGQSGQGSSGQPGRSLAPGEAHRYVRLQLHSSDGRKAPGQSHLPRITCTNGPTQRRFRLPGRMESFVGTLSAIRRSATATASASLSCVRWCERDQDDADKHKNSHPYQFSACDHVATCLGAHESGVRETRPCCEGDYAATRRRIADG